MKAPGWLRHACRGHDGQMIMQRGAAERLAAEGDFDGTVVFLFQPNDAHGLDDQGHGLGMQLTEWPSHASFDTTEIAPNMGLTLEPSFSYGDGRIMVHEKNIVVRAEGVHLLSERAATERPVI